MSNDDGSNDGTREGTQDPTLDRRHQVVARDGDLPEGMEIGEYRVLRKIGEGGMGSVYAGIQPTIGKRVAIKVIAAHIASNLEIVARFVDEARAVNKIGHPNIVDIFSFGRLPDGRHYFAMEFLDGRTLGDRMNEGPIPPRECRRLLHQICEALEAAHRQGIVHRDLKPDNIWIAEPQHGESFAKLLDFGIAKLMGEGEGARRTQTGVIMGTPAYMSPEQCRGEGIGRATDIYALGVILYELFTRRLPFQGSFAELVTQHLMATPEPPSRFAAVPEALDRLILSCLEKDPTRRPASAEDLGRALAAAFPPVTPMLLPVMAAPPTMVQPSAAPSDGTLEPAPGRTANGRTQLPARDRKPLLFVAGIAVTALVVTAVMSAGRHRTTPRPSPPVATPVPPPPATPAVGGVHVVVKDGEARVLIDGKLVASGAREARVPDVSAGEVHHLRVEAAGRPPQERSFSVAAGMEVELEVRLAPPPTASAEARPAPRPPGERVHRRAQAGEATEPPHAAPATKPHHRDGLVGDDIFDAPNRGGQ